MRHLKIENVIFSVLGHTVYRNRVRVGLGVELVTLGLVLGFGRGLGIGYKSIFIGKKSRFSFELAHALDSRVMLGWLCLLENESLNGNI